MVKTVYPKKSLGQHFLSDLYYCRRIVQEAALGPSDIVVEIGPGTGNLTKLLLEKVQRVIGIEFDSRMVEVLRARFELDILDSPSRFQLIQANVLQLDWDSVLSSITRGMHRIKDQKPWVLIPAKIVGNLPYNIATHLLTSMTETDFRFQSSVFMTQREVASRMRASPGSKDYGYFSLLMQFHFSIGEGFDVPPGAFTPVPKVVSHVTRFEPRPPELERSDYQRFLRIIQTAFRQRRKTLWNNLRGLVQDERLLAACFEVSGVARSRRPEEVTRDQYLCMSRMLCLKNE